MKDNKDVQDFYNKVTEITCFYSSNRTECKSQNLWYLDSGYSNHMIGECDIFISLDQNFNLQVKLGGGKI